MQMKKFCVILIITVLFLCSYSAALANEESLNIREAEALKEMGLFKGSAEGFELERAPSRIEGGVMLIRLLGKESEAIVDKSTHPFTDVPNWANYYIGYLYNNGLSKGIGNNQYGSGLIDSKSYVTLVLRSLGYDDAKGDFKWSNALEKAIEIGLIKENYIPNLKEQEFLRDHMVKVSYDALGTKLKNSENTLLEKLIAEGIVKEEVAKKYDVFVGNSLEYIEEKYLKDDQLNKEVFGIDIDTIDKYYVFGGKNFPDYIKENVIDAISKYKILERGKGSWITHFKEEYFDENYLLVFSADHPPYNKLPQKIRDGISFEDYWFLERGEYKTFKVNKATILVIKELDSTLPLQDFGVFKGYFKNPDYTDPSVFLQTGVQTKAGENIKKVCEKINDKRDISTLKEIFKIVSNLKHIDGGIKHSATAEQVLEEGTNGCTRNALLFASLAREKGIPTVLINSAHVKWIEEIQNNPNVDRTINASGHFFVEVFLSDEKWYLIDSTAGRIFTNYDRNNFSIKSGDRDYYIYAKSIEVFDSRMNSEKIGLVQRCLFEKFDLDNYKETSYEVINLD